MEENKEVTEILPEKGIVSMNGFRYWYEHIVAHKGDMCLSTKNPNKYCNGYHAYSPKDPGSSKCFVIIETDDPNVYDTAPVEAEEPKVDSVVMHEGFDKPADSFGTSNDPYLIEKWRPMLEAQGITDPYKLAWMADYCENHIKVDRENIAKGKKIIGDGIGELLGIEEGNTEEMDKVQESLMFTEPESVERLPDLDDDDRDAIDEWDDSIIKSEEDAELFCESIENPKPPNENLKKAVKKYKGETEFKDPVKSEPIKNPGFFRRILNWFTS